MSLQSKVYLAISQGLDLHHPTRTITNNVMAEIQKNTILLEDLENILLVHLSGTTSLCTKVNDVREGIMKAVKQHIKYSV